MLFKYGFTDEMFPMVRTDVLREFPFPEPIGARFVPEGFVWSAIGVKYRTIFINDPLRVYASFETSVDNSDKLTNPATLVKNAPSIVLYYRAILIRDILWIRFAPLIFIRFSAAYVYYSLLGGVRLYKQIAGLPLISKLLWVIAFPIGVAKFLQHKYKMVAN